MLSCLYNKRLYMIKLKTFFSIVGSGLNQASLICNPVRMNNFLFKKFLTLFKCQIIFLLEWPNSTDPTLLLEGAIYVYRCHNSKP